MSTHKYIERICCAVLAIVIVITAVFMNGDKFGIESAAAGFGYEKKLFDDSTVHTIDIIMDDWDEFISTCENEEYAACSVIIDNEAYKNVAIRAKGNTSLRNVSSMGSDRYSFKIEFDHYDNNKNYYGLDKLCLNNLIQDDTIIKDYLVYKMMGDFDTASPLCSFVYITVNGEDWGLYLAAEGIEESFLERNYGRSYGELYKPESTGMGEGGKNANFDMAQMPDMPVPNGEFKIPVDEMPEITDITAQDNKMKNTVRQENRMQDRAGMMGGSGALLKYTDDEYDSYSTIFDSSKTDINDLDKDRLISALKILNEGENVEEAVDVDSVIRYFVVHNFVCNFDSYTGSIIHNYYLYEEDGKLAMIPWDYNLAFGSFQGGMDASTLVNYPIDSPVSGSIEDRPMIAWIFNDETYTEIYHQYFKEFVENYFESGYFENLMDSVKNMISPYVEKDPTKFCTYEEFENGIDTLKEFCLLRAESVKGQIEGTIPSDSESQKNNTEAFVDASSIDTSETGSMGMGGGNRGFEKNTGGERPERVQMAENMSLKNDEANENTFEPPAVSMKNETVQTEAWQERMQNTDRINKGNTDFNTIQEQDNSNVLLFGISAAVLVIGLLIAFKFKR